MIAFQRGEFDRKGKTDNIENAWRWGIKEPSFKRARLTEKTHVPDGSVPSWGSGLKQTKADLKQEENVDNVYMRRKLKLPPKAGNVPRCKPVLPDANVGLFIPSIVIPMINANKPVWIILEHSFEGVPLPWHCNLLTGGSASCPQRGGVQIIGHCFIEECELLTKELHTGNLGKHLQPVYIDGSFYVSLQKMY